MCVCVLCAFSPLSAWPPGFHTTTRELQTCTFDPVFQNTTKKPREDPRERQKEREWSGRGIKKRKILGPPTLRDRTDCETIIFGQKWIGQKWSNKDGQKRIGQKRSQPMAQPVRLRFAAHWGSWADCLQVVKAGHPMISGMMVKALADRSPTIQVVLFCERTLHDSGFDAPNWEDLAEGVRPHQDESQVH